ncbi:MAG: hypothetical protein KKD73_03925 [Proteobacteria bacterium]|nr:hypothetical protein [Pseudomonadota bacterium]MBU1639731.1 hypothetical protein [Pseudomonadota bacterium]
MLIQVEKEKFRAVIFTESLKVEGTIHLLPQERMTDYMEETEKTFIPVTYAIVSSIITGEVLHTTEFLSLNKNEVTVICPIESED